MIKNFSETTFIWWEIFMVLALFSPPIPLGFTDTSSNVSSSLVIACLYIVWRTFYTKFRIINPSTIIGFVLTSLTIFFSFHSVYFLLAENKPNVFLLECQWIVYFIASLLMIFDMRHMEDCAQKIIKYLLILLFIEGCLGIITSFTGPIYKYAVGWYEGRFGFNIFRAIGTSSSANGLAGMMAFSLIITIFTPAKYLPLRKSVLGIVFAIALLFTQSKSGISTFFVAFIIIGFLQLLKYRSYKRFFKLYAIIGFLGLLVYQFKEFIFLVSTDLSSRKNFGQVVMNQFYENSVFNQIFGIGFRQSAWINPETHGWVTAHNSYISFLAEIGILGCSILFALVISTFFNLYKQNSWPLLGGFLVILIHLLSEGFIYGYTYISLITLVFTISIINKKSVDAFS
ncbi:hypothetical protein LKM19_12945 [Bacillus cereus]|uniref:O-antigen ligase family protein n=1 Tax=Bacillus cereus TaxID=1396 RepID=UPI001D0E82CC|nr:O-antigen ligase family protein [Bacillus cereus]MCC2361666.1 hypothetical protein [Bacillus cereus]